MKKIALAAAALLATTAMPALADPITYTFSGDFTGTLAGTPFAATATFTGVGDTSAAFMSGLTKYVPLTSLTVAAPGGPYTVGTTTQFYFNNGNFAGLFFGSNGTGGGSFAGGPLTGYNGVSTMPTTALTVTAAPFAFFTTNQGDVILDSFTNGSFSASVASSAAVPEPATWGMMILGFGVAGYAMRRRAKVRTDVSFA